MKLGTTIEPRKDGTVTAKFGESLYTFSADADCALTCDVDNDEHVALLLNTGNFYPADAESFEEAAALVAGDDTAAEDDEAAAPIEANTPPADKKRKTRGTAH